MTIAEQIAGAGTVGVEHRDNTGREDVRHLVGALMLIGKSEASQRLRLQVQVAAPHLRSAMLEAEPGLARELLARRLYAQSGASLSGLVTCDAASAEAIDELCSKNRVEGVLLSAVAAAKPASQRQLAGFIRQSQQKHGTRWLVFSEQSVKTLVAQKQLVPELARMIPEITVRLAPLRERPEDLRSLCQEVLRLLEIRQSLLTPEALQVLAAHRWPGDLEEFVQAVSLWANGEDTSSTALANILLFPRAAGKTRSDPAHVPAVDTGPTLLQDVIDRHLLRILQRCHGNKLRAAEMLGISRSTLYRMLEAATPA